MKNTSQISQLNNKIADLEMVISESKSAMDHLTKERDYFSLEVEHLQQRVKLLSAALYGKKSEKLKAGDIEDIKQDVLPNLFNEAETIADQPDNIEEDGKDDDVEIPKTSKPKKRGRKPLPKDLPRKEIIHDLTDKEKICHCGCTMNKIGEEYSEELEHIPAILRVLKHIRYKYACRKCHENVQIAKAPLKIIDKGICSASVIANSLVSKFEDHLPFYRQSQMFKRK